MSDQSRDKSHQWYKEHCTQMPSDISPADRSLTLELDYYRQVIERTSYVMKINLNGSILSVNEKLSRLMALYNIDSSQLSDIYHLLPDKQIDSIFQHCKSREVYIQPSSLILDQEHFSVILTAFSTNIQSNELSEITLIFNKFDSLPQPSGGSFRHFYYDELTGLANRQQLFKDLEKQESNSALMFIDIENFSDINHLYGFASGDTILKQMAELLNHFSLDQHPTKMYRIDMDHFALLIDKSNGLTNEMLKCIADGLIIVIENHLFSIDDSLQLDIGVTIGASTEGKLDLFSETNMALTTAKAKRRPFLLYNHLDNSEKNFKNNLEIQRKLKTAISNDLLINHYQPIVDKQGNVVKYEALVRMHDPDNPHRILKPVHFLEIAKQSKNYPLLTNRVIANAFRDFGDGHCGFSLNLSFEDINNPEVVSHLTTLLEYYPDARLTIELLESEGMIDLQRTVNFCNELKSHGVEIAIDDFGSGYSNFTHFFDIPIDILKIDGSLVRRIHDYRGYLILKSIIQFANSLGVKTVAEFVESESIFYKLKDLGVDYFQGYHFSAPTTQTRVNNK